MEAKALGKAAAAEARAKAAEAKAREARAKANDAREARKIKAAKVEAANAAKAREAKAWEKRSESKVVEAILRVQAAVARTDTGGRMGMGMHGHGLDEPEVLSYPLARVSSGIFSPPSITYYGVTRNLWHHSREARDEYSCIIEFIAPITRLSVELLQQIFLIIIDETNGPPSVLILVCKYWLATVTSIWAALTIKRDAHSIVTTAD